MSSPTFTRVTEFEILRDVVSDSRRRVPLARKPEMVCTLLDEAEFLKRQALSNRRAVFIEDQMHDWSWRDGELSFYPRKGDCVDVLVIYATEEAPETVIFDPMTGKRLSS